MGLCTFALLSQMASSPQYADAATGGPEAGLRFGLSRTGTMGIFVAMCATGSSIGT